MTNQNSISPNLKIPLYEHDYSSNELMVINAARMLKNRDVVFVGIGLPNLACNLAWRTHAPDLILIYEAGVIGASPSRVPLSIGDPALVSGALSVIDMYDIFAFLLQRGNVDVGFLGGAQIDKYGNINATIIGDDYAHPAVRLPGSGGSQEIAAWAHKCYIITPHQKRRLPEKVDFITSCGCFPTHDARRNEHLMGRGPVAVITDIGILEPDPTGELTLTNLHPGKTVQSAIDNTGWDLKVANHLKITAPIKRLELKTLREISDPSIHHR